MFSSNIFDFRIHFCLLIKQNGIFNFVPSLTVARFSRSLSISGCKLLLAKIYCGITQCVFERSGFNCRIQKLKVFCLCRLTETCFLRLFSVKINFVLFVNFLQIVLILGWQNANYSLYVLLKSQWLKLLTKAEAGDRIHHKPSVWRFVFS